MQPTDRKQSMNRIIGYLSVRTKRERYTKEVEREDGNMSITRQGHPTVRFGEYLFGRPKIT